MVALSLFFSFLSASRQSEPFHHQAIKMRRAEYSDIPGIIELAGDVFGDDNDTGFGWLFNQVLRTQVNIGFNARIAAAETCGQRDHCIFCLADDELAGEAGSDVEPYSGVRAIVELSIQPTNGRTAPMFPTSLEKKREAAAKAGQPLRPYLSNLVVDPRFRRRGMAAQLVQACETQAAEWGYDDLFLHVDVDEPPAVGLYEKLGYVTISEDSQLKKLLSGVRLRYMTKKV